MARKLISTEMEAKAKELQQGIVMQELSIRLVELVRRTYDAPIPSNMEQYRNVAGPICEFFRRSIMFAECGDDAVRLANRQLIKELWYDTIVHEVRCIQGHCSNQSERRASIDRHLAEARMVLNQDMDRLAAMIDEQSLTAFNDRRINEIGQLVDNIQLQIHLKANKHKMATGLRVVEGAKDETRQSNSAQMVEALA